MLSAETHRGNRETIREGSYGLFLYNFYRTYDPNTGRYLEADPIGQGSGANLYSYVYGNPANWLDFFGLDGLMRCDRPTHGPMPGNHTYLWNPETEENEGRGGCSSGCEGQSKEDPRKNRDACVPVPGTEGKENEILEDLNRTANKGPWVPFANDCHNAVDRVLERHDVPVVPSPNGRFGRSNPGASLP